MAIRKLLDGWRDVLWRKGRRSILVIDHTGYDGRHVRGASAKGEAVDQAAELVVADPFGIGRVGRARIWSRKGRWGTGRSRR